MHILFHLLKLIVTAFMKDNKERQTHEYGNIQFDRRTKISVFVESLKKLNNKNISGLELIEEEKYVRKLAENLKKEFDYSPEQLEAVDNILFEISYGTNDWKLIKKNISRLNM